MSYSLWKRLFDLFFGIPLFLLSLPAIFMSAVVIFFIDGLPVFYFQEREGLNGILFKVWKLRTMRRNSEKILENYFLANPSAREEWEGHFKLENDPRIIPIAGDFLRRFSVDELPQFWNVVVGEMSLVGPRAFPHYHLEKFSPEFRKLRSSVLPGITGLWQVDARGLRDLSIQQELDEKYIANCSISLDFLILISTPLHIIFRRRGIF